jgi:uncharacterized protein (DUF885 family)
MLFRSIFYFVLSCALAAVTTRSAEPSRSNPAQIILDSKGKTPEAARLKQFFDAHWKYSMEEAPEAATYAGYPGLNDRWSDLSSSAIQRRKEDTHSWLQALESIDRAKLGPADQLNFDLFRKELLLDIEGEKFPSELMPLNQMNGVQQDIAQTLSLMPLEREKDFHDVIARIRAAPKLIDQNIALLRLGLAQRVTPPRIVLRDVSQQIQNQIVEDLRRNPVYAPFTNFPSSISGNVRASLTNDAEIAIREQLLPAWRKLSDYFSKEYLPNTRESVAASDLPDGKAWYAFRVRRYTTTDMSPEQIHQIGLNEVTRIRGQMERVIREANFSGSFAEFCDFLRTDPQFFYKRADDLMTGYRDICKKVDPELAKLFGKLPRLPYGVLPVPSYAEKSQTTAYYQPGAASFGRAGYFFANTYQLNTRPKWEMEALTLHEAVPGHHLQIALAQEMEGAPEFRKHGETTAFVEGWGLYSESLGEEMGFYKDPYSKFGQLTYEMWRAIRLVVDTGMHALGWSREQAIDFFKKNSAKSEHDITVEIDRYIAWPGQALAYKIGELKIKELRRKAETQLGAKFNIREFHDQLLAEGAIPLDLLEQRMNAWLEAKRRN